MVFEWRLQDSYLFSFLKRQISKAWIDVILCTKLLENSFFFSLKKEVKIIDRGLNRKSFFFFSHEFSVIKPEDPFKTCLEPLAVRSHCWGSAGTSAFPVRLEISSGNKAVGPEASKWPFRCWNRCDGVQAGPLRAFRCPWYGITKLLANV